VLYVTLFYFKFYTDKQNKEREVMKKVLVLLSILFLLVTFAFCQTTVIASDDGSNYGGGWTNGSNGGSGFGTWSLSATPGTGYAGWFIGDPSGAGISGMSTTSFGLYANPDGSGAVVNADRTFSSALKSGDIFSFQWGVNWDSNGSGNKGFELFTGGTSGTRLLNINMGGSAVIGITDESNTSSTMFNNYGTNSMTINIKMENATTLRVYATGRDGSESYDNTFSISSAPDAFRFYATNLSNDTGDNRQPYFDQLTVTEPDGEVPVTLASFTATAIKGKVELAWVTESEAENSHFLIYRDGEVIGQVEGNGTTTETHNYSFVDDKVVPGVHEYALADVTYGGVEEMHESVEVEVKAEVEAASFALNSAYPNPFNPDTRIEYYMSRRINLRLGVYNLQGEKVADLFNGIQEAGTHTAIWDATGFPSGIYVVRMMSDGMLQTMKIVLMK
jgi:hypothetical protein